MALYNDDPLCVLLMGWRKASFCNQVMSRSIKFISYQIKKLDIQCALCNIHTKLFHNKHLATLIVNSVICKETLMLQL